jgi:hypothetical protein
MKKSIILGGSILCLFLLVSLSYQPMIASEIRGSSRLKVYFSEAHLYIEKRYYGGRSTGCHGCQATFLYLDADLDELIIDVVMNYSVKMNYSYIFTRPLYFAPILAYGIMVENYAEYEWRTIKLGNYGSNYVEGNFSVEVEIDMDDVASGDVLLIKPYYVYLREYEYLNDYNFIPPDNNSMKWAIILRILFNIPVIGEYLLHNWLLPYLEPYNRYPPIEDDVIGPGIWLYFN